MDTGREDSARKSGDTADSPLLAHLVFIKMEDIMDKLKLLDYENGFCKELKIKPFYKYYFATSTNPGEQFFVFSNLAVWLINCSGKKLDQPQEYDDPNATISTIIVEAKQLGISVNFPPTKLKSGMGEQVCHLLDGLAETALDAVGFSWKSPVYRDEGNEEEIVQEDGVELSLSHLEEELAVEDEGEESDGDAPIYLDLSAIQQGRDENVGSTLDDVLESTVDAKEWRLEVERVTPSLKVHVRQDNRDWRAHYEQMHTHNSGIESTLTETKVYLDKLHQEISKTLEKIGSRENYINNQLDGLIQEFRRSQDRLSEVREKYKTGNSSVNELARELAQVTEELEAVKADMDEKGTSMTDAGPLVKVKQSLTRLKSECTQMDVRIGVIDHTLLEAKFKNKTAIKKQMNATAQNSLF